jgi:integrase
MKTLHFKLRIQGQSTPKIVLHVFDSRFKGRKFMYSTRHSIEQKHWNKQKERAKPAPANAIEEHLKGINKSLDLIQLTVMRFLDQNFGVNTLERSSLKAALDEAISTGPAPRIEKIRANNDFFEVWDRIINTTKNQKGILLTNGTKNSKRQTLSLLKDFQASQSSALSFDTLDMKFYHALDAFMIKKGLNDNSRGKHFKEIKAVLREAIDRDIAVNLSFQKKSFKVIRSVPDNVYLSEDELRHLLTLKLTPGQERQRDIFVMACFVGARHSDWPQINANNVVTINGKEMLRLKQTKTGEIVHVPVHPVVRDILTKYQGIPPKVIANQKFNEALKVIAKKAQLGQVTIGGMAVDKSEMVSTHTARRSFATNAYLSKMDVYQIMKLTGHKSESSFLRYLKLDGKDFAIQAADSEFFRDEAWRMKIAS